MRKIFLLILFPKEVNGKKTAQEEEGRGRET